MYSYNRIGFFDLQTQRNFKRQIIQSSAFKFMFLNKEFTNNENQCLCQGLNKS